jgi:hypothetical protein
MPEYVHLPLLSSTLLYSTLRFPSTHTTPHHIYHIFLSHRIVSFQSHRITSHCSRWRAFIYLFANRTSPVQSSPVTPAPAPVQSSPSATIHRLAPPSIGRNLDMPPLLPLPVPPRGGLPVSSVPDPVPEPGARADAVRRAGSAAFCCASMPPPRPAPVPVAWRLLSFSLPLPSVPLPECSPRLPPTALDCACMPPPEGTSAPEDEDEGAANAASVPADLLTRRSSARLLCRLDCRLPRMELLAAAYPYGRLTRLPLAPLLAPRAAGAYDDEDEDEDPLTSALGLLVGPRPATAKAAAEAEAATAALSPAPVPAAPC